MSECDTGTLDVPCKGCPDCGPTCRKRTPEAISARLGKVSEGPWTAWDRGIGYEVHGPEGEPINNRHRETFTKGDAEFIAMAPGDVHHLLALARKQAAALDAVRKIVDDKYRIWAAVCGNTCSKDLMGVDHDAIADEINSVVHAAITEALES